VSAGVAAGEALGVAVATDVVVVAGDVAAVAGVVPATGESPGAVEAGFVTGAVIAGLVTGFETGGATGAFGGTEAAGGGGAWPNEVNAIVTEQRLAINSVFIG
jgi:hypothetical protein